MKTTALAPLGAAPVALLTTFAPDWQQAAGDWRDNLKSDRTRRAYLEAWAAFLSFAQVEPADVTQSHVIAYRKHLKTAPSPPCGNPPSSTPASSLYRSNSRACEPVSNRKPLWPVKVTVRGPIAIPPNIRIPAGAPNKAPTSGIFPGKSTGATS